MIPRKLILILAALACLFFATVVTSAQWVPTGPAAGIPVVPDCGRTGGDAAVSLILPTGRVIFYCQPIIAQIDGYYPGGSNFILAHEFGHQVLNTTDEPSADCWAAQQVVGSPNGRAILNVAIKMFWDRGNIYHPRYGTGFDRARRIYDCAAPAMLPGAGIGGAPAAQPSIEDAMVAVNLAAPQPTTTADVSAAAVTLLDAAQTSFVSLRGPAATGAANEIQKQYKTTLNINNFDECVTYDRSVGYPSPTYTCKKNVPNLDIDQKFAEIVNSIRSKIPAGWSISEVAGQTNFVAREGEGKRTVSVVGVRGSTGTGEVAIWFAAPETKVP